MQVVKRDGRIVKFNRSKIASAVEKALIATDGASISEHAQSSNKKFANAVADIVDDRVASSEQNQITVENIQDEVERILMDSDRKDVAKNYILYRDKRTQIREHNSTINKQISKRLTASHTEKQNANVDEKSFGGKMGAVTSDALKNYALYHCMSEMSRNNHLNNMIYIHDLDHYAVGDHNCLSIPFDKLLAEGFNTRQTDIRPAQSVNTAFQLIAVIFQLQSLQQFGGVSATHLDWTMVPYVRKSLRKHYILESLKDQDEFYSLDLDAMTEEELDDWVNDYKSKFYEDTGLKDEDFYIDNKFLDPVIYKRALFETRREVYQAVEGMYHNLNTLQSRSGNQLPFTSINYGTCVFPEAKMVTRALLEMSIKGIGRLHRTSIFPCGIFQCMRGINRHPGDSNYDLYRLALKSTAKRLYPNYANVDWSGNAGYDRNDPKTYFSTMGALAGEERLLVKVGDAQPEAMSIRMLFDTCKSRNTAAKQPAERLEIQDKPGVLAITYQPYDITVIKGVSSVSQYVAELSQQQKSKSLSPITYCGKQLNVTSYKLEVLEYGDNYDYLRSKYSSGAITSYPIRISMSTYKAIQIAEDEKPTWKQDTSILQEVINVADMNIKIYDADNRWTKVNTIFRNDKLNTPQMMHITYNDGVQDHILSCTEDHPLWVGDKFLRADKLTTKHKLYLFDGSTVDVVSIKWAPKPVEAYDVSTATGTFIGSNIVMHNCRTANGWDINGLGQQKDGRGNICPVTIIMPTLAMEVSDKKDKVSAFMKLLDKKIHEAKDMLIERFEYICNQSADSAKFMYENGLMAGYDGKSIRSALKHGTLAVGQLGLAETLQILIGCDHTEERGMELAKKIEQLFKDRCAEFKQKYKLNFGVYFTPAENLCFTAMTRFKEKYGEIPNVSDKKFFTNSIHVPVWKKMTPSQKIDIESQLTGYSSAGCITYVELEGSVKHNIDALEQIVNYAMDHDVPYFAVNVPNDMCMSCGYTDEIGDNCPMCNGNNIRRLRRVTGYLTGDFMTAFNEGKQQETMMRVKHG